jgi:hypothetical protein
MTLRYLKDPRWGGAYYSLQEDGYEYINAYDTGRLVQTAMIYDWYGEAQNPTQGGAQSDPAWDSSSQVLYETGNVVVTNMAYWYPWGGQVLSGTVVGTTTDILSDHLIRDHVVTNHGAAHQNAGVEIRTAYLQPQLNVMISYDPANVTYSMLQGGWVLPPGQLNWTNNAAKDAILACTPGLQQCIGMWSPDADGMYAVSYTNDPQSPTVKIDAWADEWDIQQAESFQYDVYIAVGTVEEVMSALHQAWLMEAQ